MSLKPLLDYEVLKKFADEKNLDFLALYGSFHKGLQNSESDIDLLVDSKSEITSENLEEWSNELEKIIKRKIDLITARMMISSNLCGYVWRLKDYTTIMGNPYIHKDDFIS
jgi:predicted nucleotidyltransferase